MIHNCVFLATQAQQKLLRFTLHLICINISTTGLLGYGCLLELQPAQGQANSIDTGPWFSLSGYSEQGALTQTESIPTSKHHKTWVGFKSRQLADSYWSKETKSRREGWGYSSAVPPPRTTGPWWGDEAQLQPWAGPDLKGLHWNCGGLPAGRMNSYCRGESDRRS